MTLPLPELDVSLTNWIDSLESKQILSLLDLWNGKTTFEDIPELIDYLKNTYKKSYIIKQHYENSINKKRKAALFDKLDIASELQFKRSIKQHRFTSNCGSSQCEFRFNGCDHSP